MSPEQARGRSVDRRADVWAFGCVLYEMLSGRRPFDGTDVTDVLAAVVRDAPTFDALPPDVPPAVRRLLRRCLEKDPSRRLDSMRDARLEINDSSNVATLEQPVRRRGSAALLTAGALLAIPGLVLLGYALGRTPTPISAPPSHVELTVAPATSLGGPPARADRPTRHALVVTSDGTRIVFVGTAAATSQLYVRSLDARQANVIPGTEGAHTPFLSPDNQWVGFLADGIIRKVPLAGGPVVTVA